MVRRWISWSSDGMTTIDFGVRSQTNRHSIVYPWNPFQAACRARRRRCMDARIKYAHDVCGLGASRRLPNDVWRLPPDNVMPGLRPGHPCVGAALRGQECLRAEQSRTTTCRSHVFTHTSTHEPCAFCASFRAHPTRFQNAFCDAFSCTDLRKLSCVFMRNFRVENAHVFYAKNRAKMRMKNDAKNARF